MIKDNRIQVRAKHEEKTSERLCKSKYAREYELGEKIETLSLTGGLSTDGRLYVGAFAKGHGHGTAAAETETETNDSAKTEPDAAGGDTSNAATASTDDDAGDTAAALQPCTVLAAGTSTATATASSTSSASATTTSN